MQVADSRDGGGEKYFWVARKRFKTFDSQKYLICELKRTGYRIIFTICTVNMLSNKPLNKQMAGDQNVSLTFYFCSIPCGACYSDLARNSIWQIGQSILGKHIHSQLTPQVLSTHSSCRAGIQDKFSLYWEQQTSNNHGHWQQTSKTSIPIFLMDLTLMKLQLVLFQSGNVVQTFRNI